MKFGSLFTGIGGIDLGLERAGMECAWQVEIDPFCRRVLERHWPSVTRLDDVKALVGVGMYLGGIGLLAGGFPCQDISDAHTNGKRLALEGHRSGLWVEFLRLIGELTPRFVLIENVAAWRRWVPGVRSDLWRLGYSSLPIQVRAADVGAPHERPRVFVLAHANRNGESLRAVHAEMARLPPVSIPDGHWRSSPPGGFRMADGVPGAMDRNRACGNSAVPQVVERIGRAILGAA